MINKTEPKGENSTDVTTASLPICLYYSLKIQKKERKQDQIIRWVGTGQLRLGKKPKSCHVQLKVKVQLFPPVLKAKRRD